MKYFWKSVLYLFIRIVFICFLAFMTYIIVSKFPEVLAPVMAVFYFVVTMYFFVFTMWYEGGKDIKRAACNQIRYFPAKGFLSAGIVGTFMTAVYFMPNLFARGSTACSVAWLVKYYFLLPSSYASIPFVDTTMTEEEYNALKAAMSGTIDIKIALFYFGFLAAWIIGAGIGYIVGYKQIKIFQPILDKWKRD